MPNMATCKLPCWTSVTGRNDRPNFLNRFLPFVGHSLGVLENLYLWLAQLISVYTISPRSVWRKPYRSWWSAASRSRASLILSVENKGIIEKAGC